MYTSMHSEGLELTKLTYTRLEDNLIRHRGDRHVSEGDHQTTRGDPVSWSATPENSLTNTPAI